METKTEIIPTSNEVIKNRVFGMPTTKMTRHQRVSFTAMVKIAYDDLKKNSEQKLFEFPTDKFLDMIGITKARKQSHLFTQIFVDEEGWEQEKDTYALEKTLRELLNKTILFRFKNELGKTYKVEGATLLSDFSITREKVKFGFSEWIRSKIFITNNAYIMKMPIIASFGSGYTVTLFEQIEQRRDFNRWEVSLAALKKIFGIDEETYDRFTNFRIRVLEVARDEINEKSSYSLDYELIKKGRKVDKIVFSWHINKISIMEFKKYIRKNFVNVPLIEITGANDIVHIIQVSESGKLYNAKNPARYYRTKQAKDIWDTMFKNQDKLLIKKEIEHIENFSEKDFTKYYGADLIFGGETYINIVSIAPIATKNKLKVLFKDKTVLIIDEEEFLASISFPKS